MLCSVHDITIALLNSQQQWLPAQDLHKIKPLSMGEGETHEVPPLAEELLTINGCQGKKSHCS